MLRLGRFYYNKPVVVLAPMAGISDLPFRQMCQQLGCHFTIAEMINARSDLLHSVQSQTRAQFDDNPAFPKIVQLAGGNPQLMAEAAQLIQAQGADVIDINMGCPAKKVGRQNAGSALLADLTQVKQILKATVNAVNIPVTLKTRIGFNDQQINLAEVGKIAQDTGIVAISIHGRTRAQRFTGVARYQEIAELKQNISLPVIVNGDITTAEQAQSLVRQYDFDGVMIGRATQGNPWLLAEIRHALDRNWQLPPINKQPFIYQHINALHQLYPAPHSVLCARKHLHWYYRQHPKYTTILREAINRYKLPQEQLDVIQSFPVEGNIKSTI